MTIDVSTVTLTNGLTLSYADQGARSEPPVVLVPGATDSLWEDPDRFASDLAAFVEVTGADRG